MDIRSVYLQRFIRFFDRKTPVPIIIKLTEELPKSINRKCEKQRVHSSFLDHICDVDLADLYLLSKFNKGIHFLLFVISFYSKYAWAIPLKDKKCFTIINASQKY